MVLVVDAGHGGIDPGAVNGSVREAWLAWDLSSWILNLAAEYGVAAFRVPHDWRTVKPNPLRFRNRVSIARDFAPSHFVSLHWNAHSNSTAHGTEVWVPRDARPRDMRFARVLVKNVSESISTKNRGVKNESQNRHGGLGILRNHLKDTRRCLLEVAFISNPGDLDASKGGMEAVARAVLKSVVETV